MKRKLLFLVLPLLLTLFWGHAAYAQIGSYYTLSESTETYSEITGGTVSTASGDDGEETGIAIGFNFDYVGTTYTTVTVGVNGAISFTSTNIDYVNNLASTDGDNLDYVAPLWDDMYARPEDSYEIRYETAGTTPNQTFAVQWKNISWRNAGMTVNFQIVFYEGSNNILFNYGTNNSTDSRDASIGLNVTPGASGNFISVTPGSPATTSTTTANNSIDVTDYPGDGHVYTFTYAPPSCPDPTAQTETNITATSADLGWTENGGATTWEIEWGVTGFTQGSGTMVTGITVNPHPLSGLTANTTYDWYVRADCGGGDYSNWVGESTFTTLVSCPAPTAQTESNILTTSADLGWTENGSATTWEIEWGPTGFTQGSGTMVTGITVNPYPLTGLTAATTYDWYVRADCGGDYSAWVGESTFTTACAAKTAPWSDDFEAHTPTTNATWGECWSASPAETTAYFRWDLDGGGSTPSSGTGPDVANSGTNYAYTESSSGAAGDFAELYSPFIDVSGLTTPALTFYYHMYGAAMGTLHVDVHDGTSWTNDEVTIVGQQQTSGSDPWIEQFVDLSSYSGTIQVRFRGERGSSYTSDMSIDDFSVDEAPTCPAPTAQNETNITTTSANLGWTENGTATTWEIEWGVTGFTQGSGTMITGITVNPHPLTGLTPATTYDWYVRADCGGNYSAWVGESTFTTNAEPVTTYPWNEGFENGGSIPAGWSNEYVSATVDWSYQDGGQSSNPASAHSGSYNALFYSANYGGDQTKLVTLPLDLSGLTSPELTFWHTQADWGGDQDELRVYYKTSSSGAWTLIPGQTYTTSITIWTQESGIVLPSPSADYYIAFEGLSGYGYGVCVDDVTVEEAPSCLPPTAQTVTNITTTSADLGWTENNGATIWNIEYGLSGFTPGSGTLVTGTTLNPYPLAGLSASTTYDWYVQTDCGGGSTSPWTASNTFTTVCASVTIPYFESFDGVTAPVFPACMTVENVNADNFEWKTSTTAFSLPNGAMIEYNFDGTTAMDDWFFTQELQLTGGTTYNVSFAYAGENSTYPEKLAVDWGTAADAASMSGTPIFDNNNILGGWYSGNGSFTPATTGTYYVGFHGYSDANMWNLYVDDVKVLEEIASTTWTGTVDNDWNTPGNWNPGMPSSVTDITIPTGLTNYPTLSGFGDCKNFTMQSDASLVGVNYLTVSGTTTIARSIDGYTGDGDGFHFLSAPVSAFTIAGSDFEPASGTDDFFGWHEATGMWLNYYDGLTDTEFGVGKGYLVAYDPTNAGSFSGDLNTSSFTRDLSYTLGEGNGWNLFGNPYTSAIDWDELTLTGGDIHGAVYVLKGTDNTYDSWNGSAGDLTDGHIPINNGFFVKAGSAGQSIGIDPADQVHGVRDFMKNGNDEGPENTLKISIANDDFVNNAYIQFREDASVEFDNAIDAYKLFGTGHGPQLFTKYSETVYSINCVPFSEKQFDMNMGFITKTSGSYTISAEGINTFQGNFEVYLEDVMTGSITNLGITAYTFTAETEGNENRFLLHFYNVTGLGESPAIDAAQIYAYGKTVYIRFDRLPRDVSHLDVFNTFGQQVYRGDLAPATLSTIGLNEKPGIYIVRLRTGSGLITQKVIIN